MAHEKFAFLAALALAVALAGVAHAAPEGDWTIMVYQNGDNDLEEQLVKDLQEIRRARIATGIYVVVELDRAERYYETEDDWEITLRYTKTHSDPLTSSVRRKDAVPWPLGEKDEYDMGEKRTLTDFIEWAIANYPARHRALILAGHGQGARAESGGFFSETNHRTFGPDINPGRSPSENDYLYMQEAHDAIRAGLRGKQLDVLGFDSCLMSTIEVAYGFRDVARYMVASKAKEPGEGWLYSDWLSQIKQSASAKTLATAIVESYRRHLTCEGAASDCTEGTGTLAAIDLNSIDGLAASVSGLADAMTRLRGKAEPWRKLVEARKQCAPFGHYYAIDLGRFAELVRDSIPELKEPAQKVVNALKAATVVSFAKMPKLEYGPPESGGKGSHSLSIYFPNSKADYLSDPNQDAYLRSNTCQPIDFVRSEHVRWVDFLQDVYLKEEVSCNDPRRCLKLVSPTKCSEN